MSSRAFALTLPLVLTSALLACGGSGSSSGSGGGSSGTGGECAHHGGGACDSSCACGHHDEGGEGSHCGTGCACGHHGEGGEHGGTRVAEVDALHEMLARVFHQDAGPARAADACEHAADFRRGSQTVVGVAAPAGADAAAWSSATGTLVSTADALANECAITGPAVEERLVSFHDAFHAVMDLAGGEHEHGEHEHGEHEHH
jgi:hypothetical protein